MTRGVASPADRLETLPAGEPDLTLGWEAISWAEGILIQPNGPRAGRRLRFTRDQLRFLLWFYAVDPEGRWLYNHAARRLAKGSGKSPFAAVLALIEFVAPVRIDRRDPKAPGGLRGQPVAMPWVQIAATAESQTANTMRMVRAFAPKGSAVASEYMLDVGKVKYHKLPEGTLEVITSSSTAAEGAEASFVVGDETEWWLPSNGGPALMATLADNLAKSDSRMLETANSWTPGADSVAEATYDDWLAQEEGRSRAEARILLDARIAPPETDMSDPVSLEAGLKHVYADCDWKRGPDGEVDVRPIMQRIWRASSRPDDSKRKYLNWPTAARDAWTTRERWAALADPTVTIADGDEICLFFDGSKSRDASALIGCRLDDGHIFSLGVWEPDPYDPADTVDVADVDRAVMQAFGRFKVAAFFADVREWESFALTEWPNRYRDGLELWAAPTSRPPQPVGWDMRGHAYEFAKAVEATLAEIEEGAFTHDGDAAVARHVVNARREPYRDAVSVRKASPDSPDKIDAAVCVIGARMLRRLVLTNPKRKKPKSGRAAFV